MVSPLISVILPTYNMAPLLGQAIESILAQTARDFELIVINDGSTDETGTVLNDFSQRDERVVVVDNAENQGLIRTLNHGLEIARGTFIARQDADNRSFPDRLAKQVSYLNQHPKVGLVGMPVSVVEDPCQTTVGRLLPDIILPSALIPWELLAYPYFAHDTIMARRDVMLDAGGYDLKQVYAEDYGLWVRLSRITQLAMLPSAGAHFFWNPDGVSQTFRASQEGTTAAIRSCAQSDLLGRDVSPAEARLLSTLIRAEAQSLEELNQAKRLMNELHVAYLSRYPLVESEKTLLSSRLESLFIKARQALNSGEVSL